MKAMIKTMISLTILALCSRLFNIDFQLLLIADIAYELTYIRIEKEEGKNIRTVKKYIKECMIKGRWSPIAKKVTLDHIAYFADNKDHKK